MRARNAGTLVAIAVADATGVGSLATAAAIVDGDVRVPAAGILPATMVAMSANIMERKSRSST